MCVCVCACVHVWCVCMCTCVVCVCMCTCVVCVCVHVYMCGVCMCTCVHVWCVCACVHVWCVCVHVYMCGVCVCACVHVWCVCVHVLCKWIQPKKLMYHLSTAQGDCGRPLGMYFHPQDKNTLYVADAYKGLLSIDLETRRVHTLVDARHPGKGISPMMLVDDLVVLSNGSIFFTDMSKKFSVDDVDAEVAEGRPNGRLFHYNPSDGSLHTVLGDLHAANGVCIGPNEEFLLVAETTRARLIRSVVGRRMHVIHCDTDILHVIHCDTDILHVIHCDTDILHADESVSCLGRYYLKGPKVGTFDTFVHNLPGLPDNITPSSGGGYWVAFAALRDNPVLDMVAGLPWIRALVYKVQSHW